MGTQPERLEVDEYHRVGLSIVRWCGRKTCAQTRIARSGSQHFAMSENN